MCRKVWKLQCGPHGLVIWFSDPNWMVISVDLIAVEWVLIDWAALIDEPTKFDLSIEWGYLVH